MRGVPTGRFYIFRERSSFVIDHIWMLQVVQSNGVREFYRKADMNLLVPYLPKRLSKSVAGHLIS